MHEESMTVDSQTVKARQARHLAMVAAVLLCIGLGIYWALTPAATTPDDHSPTTALTSAETVAFTSPFAQVNDQNVWRERLQNQMQAQQQQLATLKTAVTQLTTTTTREPEPRTPALPSHHEARQTAVAATSAPVSPASATHAPVTAGQVFPATAGVSGELTGQAMASVTPMPTLSPVGIDHDELHLTSRLPVRPQKNPDSFVPAGTFAEAIMLGAADASAGVSSQANPSPMLFRVIAPGTLPNQYHSHLTDCVVTAAVVGDISSERGEIRLERLSCAFPTGEIVEQPVEGTVFGRDAKNGVRGHPVWREGALLGRAAVAGSLAGLASGVSQRYTTHSLSPLGATDTVPGADILKVGAAQGASNAMEKLAEYHIRRAEQYHPVVQLSAGQAVDIVFLKGFYLDGKKHEETTTENPPPSSDLFTPAAAAPSATHGLTLTAQQVEKINAHEKAMGWLGDSSSGASS